MLGLSEQKIKVNIVARPAFSFTGEMADAQAFKESFASTATEVEESKEKKGVDYPVFETEVEFDLTTTMRHSLRQDTSGQ